MKRKYQHKSQPLQITLSPKDSRVLLAYSRSKGVSRSVAAKRIIKSFLETVDIDDSVSPNQLGLFDYCPQMEMFSK